MVKSMERLQQYKPGTAESAADSRVHAANEYSSASIPITHEMQANPADYKALVFVLASKFNIQVAHPYFSYFSFLLDQLEQPGGTEPYKGKGL